MSDETERYVRELAQHLPWRSRQRIVTEIRDHLEAATRAAQADGRPAEEAERAAIEQLGPADAMARQFTADRSRRVPSLRVTGVHTVAIAALCAGIPLTLGLASVVVLATDARSTRVASGVFVPIPNTTSLCGCTRPIPASHGQPRLRQLQTGGTLVLMNPTNGAVEATLPSLTPRTAARRPTTS
jgi:hypothetical protein